MSCLGLAPPAPASRACLLPSPAHAAGESRAHLDVTQLITRTKNLFYLQKHLKPSLTVPSLNFLLYQQLICGTIPLHTCLCSAPKQQHAFQIPLWIPIFACHLTETRGFRSPCYQPRAAELSLLPPAQHTRPTLGLCRCLDGLDTPSTLLITLGKGRLTSAAHTTAAAGTPAPGQGHLCGDPCDGKAAPGTSRGLLGLRCPKLRQLPASAHLASAGAEGPLSAAPAFLPCPGK